MGRRARVLMAGLMALLADNGRLTLCWLVGERLVSGAKARLACVVERWRWRSRWSWRKGMRDAVDDTQER